MSSNLRARRGRRQRLARIAVALAIVSMAFIGSPYLVDAWLNRGGPVGQPRDVGAAAAALHQELVIADLHADSLLWPRDLLQRHWRGQVDLPRLADGQVALQVFSVVTSVPAGAGIERNRAGFDIVTPLVIAQGWPWPTWGSRLERALYQASRLDRAAAEAPARLLRIRRRGDIARLELARADARLQGLLPPIGALLSLEGGDPVGGDPAAIDRLFAAGFRLIGLVHLVDGQLGGSGQGVDGGGLTADGRVALRRIRELGMIPDLAHASPALIRDVLDQSPGPVVVSHSGLSGHCPNGRNLDDDLARELALAGALIGIGFWPAAICGTTVDALVSAIRHAIAVVGIDHVALGSDFDGAVTTPFDVADLERLTEGLLASGLSRDEIARVMGGNAMRFLRFALPR